MGSFDPCRNRMGDRNSTSAISDDCRNPSSTLDTFGIRNTRYCRIAKYYCLGNYYWPRPLYYFLKLINMETKTKQRVTIFINPALAKQARAQAVVDDTTLTDLMERALIKYLPKVTTIKKIDINKE